MAADLFNDRAIPFFDVHEIPSLRILTDRGTKFCSNRENREYQLYLAVQNIDHSKSRVKSPQSNGICERFQKRVLSEFYQVAFRKKIYSSIDELQADVDVWCKEYNEQRPRSGKHFFGKTPNADLSGDSALAKEKMIGYHPTDSAA